MKIFITGSTGFVGKNLIEFYDQHEIYKHTRDLDVTRSLNRFEPDVILNCAAEIYNPDNMWKPNVVWTQECLEYVTDNAHVKMIQIGSSSEYGKVDRPTGERDRINPTTMYQATKGAATLLCQGYAHEYNLNISIARPYSVYGPHERSHRLFPKLWRAFKYAEPMILHHGYHDFIFIDDFVRGIDILLNKEFKATGDIVNFGSGKQYSNVDVLRAFEKVTGHNAPVTVVPNMAKEFESDVWTCDTTYAKTHYGFETEVSLEAGIKKFLETAYYEQEKI